ncbi:MAG: DoxX family protein [Candidatus Gracilibacteria bacterium]
MNLPFSPMLAITFVRIVVGLTVLSAGLNKILVAGFTHPNPFISAVLPWAEIVGGLGLTFGVLTFWAALGTSIMFLLITITMGFFAKPGALQFAYHTFILLATIPLTLIGKEPTKWSFDDWYKKTQKAKNVKKIKV